MASDGLPGSSVGDYDEALNANLRVAFNPLLDINHALNGWQACTAYMNLAGIFVRVAYPKLVGQVAFDALGLREAFRRFHRDAFGVKRFCALLDELEGGCALPKESRAAIEKQLEHVGIRINTRDPRKTKIAAAFTLWTCALKPACVRNVAISGISVEELNTFCSSLNFWIACTYLSMFGDVLLPNDDDALVRLSRIRYDLTYRNLNLSSLEMLYASIFKLRPVPHAETGDLLSFQASRPAVS